MVLLTRAVLVLLSVCGINCFNLSPNPNIIIKDPAENVNKSSFFGFAVNLRHNSILIGAPKATNNDSVLEETGEIIKCEITGLNCYPYKFHANVNVKFQNTFFQSENNEYQMLGSTMDGLGSENDKFVVCAPNLKNVDKGNHFYHVNGGCFLIQNSENPENEENTQTPEVTDIMLTKKELNQSHKKKSNHKYAQQGFSVHVTENNEEIIMGAPGVYQWSGMLMFSHNLICNNRDSIQL